MPEPLLHLQNIDAGYGHVAVLHDVTMSVAEGKIVAVLGRNGAGKSTLTKAISGLIPLSAGEITLAGERLDGRSPVSIAGAGLQYVVEGHRVFRTQTVRANLDIGLYKQPLDKEARSARRDHALELFPELSTRLNDVAGSLSGGQQQMLAIAQALVREPRMILVDEPSLGLAPVVIERVFSALVALRDLGVTILLVEQIVERTLQIADYGYVLRGGRVAAMGEPAELRTSPALQEAYMGNSAGGAAAGARP
jgi:branched-chain amino acid transport system ATP-binding protein